MADGEMAVIFCDKSAGFSMTVLVAGAMYGLAESTTERMGSPLSMSICVMKRDISPVPRLSVELL